MYVYITYSEGEWAPFLEGLKADVKLFIFNALKNVLKLFYSIMNYYYLQCGKQCFIYVL